MLESLVIAKPNLACYSLGSLWVTETASSNPGERMPGLRFQGSQFAVLAYWRFAGLIARGRLRVPGSAQRCWKSKPGLSSTLLPYKQANYFMPIVRLKENEPFEAALRRFKRTIEKTGLLTELRSREFYEKPTAERKRKHAAAVKRHYKRIRSQQLPPRLY